MNYIFVINNIDFENLKLDAEEILQMLFERNVWAFMNSQTQRKINSNDRVLVYIAGRGRRYFVADFVIASVMTKICFNPKNQKEEEFYELFDLGCLIKEVNQWGKPLSIMDVKGELNFITDKKNYGLFFRQSIKVISEEDFQLILCYRDKLNAN